MAGFLASYSGPTRQSYQTDLRMFSEWLTARQVALFEVQRAHIELYARWLEDKGRARATVGRRRSTLAGFYRYCEQEEILARSPAAHIRRPKPDYESHSLGLDRNELGEEYLLERAALTRARSEQQLVDAITTARRAGISWQKIGAALGTSAQAAQQRYSIVVEAI